MKSGEGLQPISSAPPERVFDGLPQVDRETLDRYHVGLRGLKSAMAGEVVVVDIARTPDFSPWSQLVRAGLGTLIDVERKAAEILRADITGI